MRLLLPSLFTVLILAPATWAEDTLDTQLTTSVASVLDTGDTIPFDALNSQARTLEQSLSIAARHPQIEVTEAQREQARGNLKSAKASRWFTLSGDAELGLQAYDEEDTLGNNQTGTAGVGSLGLSFNQPLVDGGRRKGAVKSAEEQLSGRIENVAWQQRLRRYVAAQAHINLWLAQELVRNNADNVSQLEKIVTEVHGRLQHGESTKTEVAEAEARLATARAVQSERVAALGNAQSAYLRDVGEAATTVEAPGDGTEANTTPSNMPHPLLVAAQHKIEEAGGNVQQNEAGYWPTLDLRGRASHNAFAGSNRESDASQAQMTLNLGYTFVDHGVVAGQTSAARAAKKATEAEYQNLKLEIEAARINAESNVTESQRRLEESTRARKESDKVITNLEDEVRQGNRTLRDLLDARRDQLASSNAWAQAYANRSLSNYDLERWR